MQDGTERCATVQDVGVVAAMQRSKREHLSVTNGASALEDVSSPIERSVGSFFLLLELL